MNDAGAGAIEYARVGDRTVVERARSNSPLRLLSPRTSTSARWTYATTFGGGLVDGDALRLSLRVRQGATALITTQGTTKVYRGAARSLVDAEVEPDATLALVGDPIVCFAGARFTQSIDVRLATGAKLVLLDALTCGRAARGERWAFARYDSRITIHRENKPILVDALRLDPRDGALVDRMRGFDAIATIVLVGLAREADRIVAAIDDERPRVGDVLEGASRIGRDALVVRLGSPTIHALGARVRSRLAFLSQLVGDDPWARKH